MKKVKLHIVKIYSTKKKHKRIKKMIDVTDNEIVNEDKIEKKMRHG